MFVAKEADFRVFQTHHVGCHDTEGYASLHPRLRVTRFARAFDLSGRAAGFLIQIITNRAQIYTILWKSAPKSVEICDKNHR